MPRRKAAKTELLPLDDDQSSQRGRKKLVEAEHTIKYNAPVPVTIEESPNEEPEDGIDDDVIEEKPRRKVKNEREELRKKLALNNVTPGSQLKLSVDRYLHSEAAEGGNWAETEFLTKYTCTEEHITNEDYLDVARKWGAGTYRFTLRMNNKIVTAWDKRLGVITPTIQNAIPGDPTSPPVIVQGDGQQPIGQVMSMRDIMKGQKEALKEHLEMTKLMREAYGLTPEAPAQPARSEEEVLTTAILKQPEVIDNLVGGIMKRYGKGGDSDEPWYADVVRDAVKSGQLVQVVQVAIDRIFNGVGNLFPGRQNNGQTEMGAPPVAPMENPPSGGSQASAPALPAHAEGPGHGAIQEGMGSVQNAETQRAISPEEQTLAIVLNNCARKVPPQITADQVLKYADLLNDQAPQYSIDGYLEMFSKMTPDQAIEFVKTQPNGEAVANLEWTKSWCEELQKLIQENFGGEE